MEAGTITTGASRSESGIWIGEPKRRVPAVEIHIALLTGGFDKPYAFGLATSLASKGVRLEVIGSDEVDSPEMHTIPGLCFLNLRGSKAEASFANRTRRVLTYYLRLIRYAATAKPRIFHILWNNKFQFFDRVVLMIYYRMCGKRVVLTAHNVNAGKRDRNDSFFNRLTLRMQYSLCHHIFVHTNRMKSELVGEFGVKEHRVSIIPFGINNSVANTGLSAAEAKRWLGIQDGEKAILFFGAIRPYKGLEFLVEAFHLLASKHPEYRLIIAGKPKEACEKYWRTIQLKIESEGTQTKVLQQTHYIPDHETEFYFKAADVVVLPYKHVFQSGVLFLAYSFGLPVVATDVGSVREDLIEGYTGFLCRACDSSDLAKTIERYFSSNLFGDLGERRELIRDYANHEHSWGAVSDITCRTYAELLGSAC